MEYYEKMRGPSFQKITVENCTIQDGVKNYKCRVCGKGQSPNYRSHQDKAFM